MPGARTRKGTRGQRVLCWVVLVVAVVLLQSLRSWEWMKGFRTVATGADAVFAESSEAKEPPATEQQQQQQQSHDPFVVVPGGEPDDDGEPAPPEREDQEEGYSGATSSPTEEEEEEDDEHYGIRAGGGDDGDDSEEEEEEGTPVLADTEDSDDGGFDADHNSTWNVGGDIYYYYSNNDDDDHYNYSNETRGNATAAADDGSYDDDDDDATLLGDEEEDALLGILRDDDNDYFYNASSRHEVEPNATEGVTNDDDDDEVEIDSATEQGSNSSSPEVDGLRQNEDDEDNGANGIDDDDNDADDGEETDSNASDDEDDGGKDQSLDKASATALAEAFTSLQNRSDLPRWSQRPIGEDELRTLLDWAHQLRVVTTKQNSVWYYWDNDDGDYLVPYNSTIHDSSKPDGPPSTDGDGTLALEAKLRDALWKARIRLPAATPNASSSPSVSFSSSFPHAALLENLVAVRKYRGGHKTRVKGGGALGNQDFPHFFSHIPKSGASYARSLLVSLLRNQSQFLALDEGDRFHACNVGTAGLGSFKTWKGHYKGTTCTMWMTEKKWTSAANHVYVILRNPKHHVLSQYFHCAESADHAKRRHRMPDLTTWLEAWDGAIGNETQKQANEQFGCYNPHNLQSSYARIASPTRIPATTGGSIDPTSSNASLETYEFEESEEELLRDLQTRYAVIGDTSRMFSSVCLMFIQYTGWVPDPCDCSGVERQLQEYKEDQHAHGVTHHGASHPTTPYQDEMIHRLTIGDQRLYDAGRRIFELRLQETEEERGIRICSSLDEKGYESATSDAVEGMRRRGLQNRRNSSE